VTKYFLLILALITCFNKNLFAISTIHTPITYGDVAIGESKIPLKATDFSIKIKLKGYKATAKLNDSSIQWVRVDQILLKPRIRLNIKINDASNNIHLSYDNQSILVHHTKDYGEAEFYFSLFQPENVLIYEGSEIIGSVEIAPKQNLNKRQTHVIDNTCARYKIKITGMDNEFLTMGCRAHRIGKMGKERYYLEVFWTSAEYTLLDGSSPPYLATFLDSRPAEMIVVNKLGHEKLISIRAKIPKRNHRIKTAYGLGPYALYSQEDGNINTSEVAPAIMLYSKFDLDEKNSIRGFDALIYGSSLFNNIGLYYANDVAQLLDRDLTITTLLGMQGMTFKFSGDTELFNQFIYPQGIELLWKNAFGIKNFIFSYGMFLSSSDTVKYNNLWIRWGKKYFWEINYIDWGYDDKYAKTWGLSIGIPFKQFF
jgi:hypothetical protein